MNGDREHDAYADAALVSVLRLLVFQDLQGEDREQPTGGLALDREVVEALDAAVQACQALPLFGFGTQWEGRAEEAYRDRRAKIDALWRVVEERGIAALRREGALRETRLPTHAIVSMPR